MLLGAARERGLAKDREEVAMRSKQEPKAKARKTLRIAKESPKDLGPRDGREKEIKGGAMRLPSKVSPCT